MINEGVGSLEEKIKRRKENQRFAHLHITKC